MRKNRFFCGRDMKNVVINADIRKFATLEIEVSDEDYAALQTDAASNIIGGDLDLACQLPRPVKGSGLAKGPCPIQFQRFVTRSCGPDVYSPTSDFCVSPQVHGTAVTSPGD